MDVLHQNDCPITTVQPEPTTGTSRYSLTTPKFIKGIKKHFYAGSGVIVDAEYQCEIIIDNSSDLARLLNDPTSDEHKKYLERLHLFLSLASAVQHVKKHDSDEHHIIVNICSRALYMKLIWLLDSFPQTSPRQTASLDS